MLRFLTDSHIPPAISTAARKLAHFEITPLRDWHGGMHLHELDPKLLHLAWEARLTMVTYDVNTFPFHVKTRLEMGFDHAGVIYISRGFSQNDVGGIAKALAKLWKARHREDWMNQIAFLEK